MQNLNELTRLGVKVISVMSDAMLFAWKFFMQQLGFVLTAPTGNHGIAKLLVAVLLVVLVVMLVGRFVSAITQLLTAIGATIVYALATLFLVGSLLWLTNVIVGSLPRNLLALN